ncbi:hypothetical protein, partial [Proteus mirabilis]|uniref:hypothetical protein n=1 Tax=Proteus mirabilis TaxID=584 RepID=UPI00195434AF
MLERGTGLAGILPDLVRAPAPAAAEAPGAAAENPGMGAALSAGQAGAMARFGRDDPLAIAVNETAIPI